MRTRQPSTPDDETRQRSRVHRRSAPGRRLTVGDLETNCWIIASAATGHAAIVDPGDEPQRIRDATNDLTIDCIVLTHTHWDHLLGVPALIDALGCPVVGHPDDHPVWPSELAHLASHGHFDAGTATDELLQCGCQLAPAKGSQLWDGDMRPTAHHDSLQLTDIVLDVLHTPGHTPGSISLVAGRHVFTGDTLFPGGPGLTGWPFSDSLSIIESIDTQLFTLPHNTAVHPGHGASTTIAAQRPQLRDWIQRGW